MHLCKQRSLVPRQEPNPYQCYIASSRKKAARAYRKQKRKAIWGEDGEVNKRYKGKIRRQAGNTNQFGDRMITTEPAKWPQ